MVRLLFLLVLCTSGSFFHAQNTFAVIAKNGLIIRDSAGSNGERLAKIPLGGYVHKIGETNKEITVVDGKEIITGKWVKVDYQGLQGGYVFDGYLIPVDSSWQIQNMEIDPYSPCNSTFSFTDFNLVIYNYQSEPEGIDYHNDSASCYELVFNEIGGKIIGVNPLIDVDSIQVLSTVNESIYEQYDYTIQGQLSEDEYNSWGEKRVHWEGHEAFVPLVKKRNYFAVPKTPYEEQELFRKNKFALRDTLVDRSGESWNVATLVYHEKPCLYVIEDVVFKVLLYKDGKAIDEKIIVINLSYGC